MADNTDPLLAEAVKIMTAVDQDHEILIRCVETLKPIVFDKTYLDRFQNTFSAHITNYLQHALHRDGISCICRIWDRDKDSLSIPNLLHEIQKEGVSDKLRIRRRSASTEILESDEGRKIVDDHGEAGQRMLERTSQRSAEKAERHLNEEFRKIQVLCNADDLKDLLHRAENWRNKFVAHSTAQTRAEKRAEAIGEQIDPVKWGELEKTLELTSEIVRLLWLVVDGLNTIPQENYETWQRYSSAFWGSFSEEPE